MQIYKGNGWETVNKHTTISSMLNKHTNIVDNAFERLKPELTDKVRDNYDEYRESTKSCYYTYKQRMVDAEAVIIDGTNHQKNIDYMRKEEVERLAKEENKSCLEILIEHVPDVFAERDGY